MKKQPAKLLDSTCRVVVLAVDTARVSGWAIRLEHRLKYSGELDTLDAHELDMVCALTASVSRTAYCQHRPILVLEKPWGGRVQTQVALGMARERWLQAWDRAGQSHTRLVSVNPSTWRSRVLMRGAHALPRDEVREHERLSAQAEVGAHITLGEDERTAVLISKWAAFSQPVAKLCGKEVQP